MVGQYPSHGHVLVRALRFRSFLPRLYVRRVLVRCVHLHRPGKPDQHALDGLETYLSSGPICAENQETVEGVGMNETEPILQVCFGENRTKVVKSFLIGNVDSRYQTSLHSFTVIVMKRYCPSRRIAGATMIQPDRWTIAQSLMTCKPWPPCSMVVDCRMFCSSRTC